MKDPQRDCIEFWEYLSKESRVETNPFFEKMVGILAWY